MQNIVYPILSLLLSFNLVQSLPVVNTKYGSIAGFQENGVNAFLGVPYAEPPIGNLRWNNPVEKNKWVNTYNATQLQPGCPQKGCKDTNPSFVCPDKTSEDCLYLNIWTPLSANSSTAFPVMVYLHGGNFVHMSVSSMLFNGQYFVKLGQVILVTLDYRLGALGFLLTKDTPTQKGATGNYGILDQQFALKWVAENIKYFGGDPNKVTLFGQSAGAQSTVIHLMNAESSIYFQKAIIESAPISIPFKDRAEELFLGEMITLELGCQPNDMACLRSKTADEVALAQKTVRGYPSSIKLLEFFEPLGPYVDGQVVPFQPLEAARRGYLQKKPFIIGSLTEETRIFIFEAWNHTISPTLYAEALLATFGRNVVEILGMYPPNNPEDERDDLQIASTDFIFTCPTRNFTRSVKTKTSIDAWVYIFDHFFSFNGWGKFTECNYHVCHGSDIPYVFQSFRYSANFTTTPEENIMSDNLINYFTNFAKNGDPSVGNPIPFNWPKYGKNTNWQSLRFKTPASELDSVFRDNYCTFWDTIGYSA
ncbi:cAMP-regulated D2 protein-like [Mytilus californianus]|uniref:cAMP-regulated D2 protein-like n=1 Tax=Mytilus californianus TaxID=6549 RepID=UPI002245F4C5|nr:cAMP-regulated D2 protein-like [Mytilus californianus]